MIHGMLERKFENMNINVRYDGLEVEYDINYSETNEEHQACLIPILILILTLAQRVSDFEASFQLSYAGYSNFFPFHNIHSPTMLFHRLLSKKLPSTFASISRNIL